MEELHRQYISSGRPHCPLQWRDLWRIHEDMSFFVIASGPSCNMINIKAEAEKSDIIIGTNWIWVKFPDVRFDYLFCCDVAPLLDAPDGIKVLTTANTEGGRVERIPARPFCILPHYGKKMWAPPEKGKPLSDSYNSGFGAMNLAAYMGARAIKVVGMDFADDGKSYHCYEDSKLHAGSGRNSEEIRKDFEKQYRINNFERVNMHLGAFIEWARKVRIVMENLSPITALNFNPA